MSGKTYPVAPGWRKRAYIDNAKYQELYAWSVADPNFFWAEQARRIDWIKPFGSVKNTSFGPNFVSIKWFEDGTTNVAQNCIDRHLARLANHTAIVWEGDDPEGTRDRSPTRNCTARFAVSPMSSRRMASKRATRSRSICR